MRDNSAEATQPYLSFSWRRRGGEWHPDALLCRGLAPVLQAVHVWRTGVGHVPLQEASILAVILSSEDAE